MTSPTIPKTHTFVTKKPMNWWCPPTPFLGVTVCRPLYTCASGVNTGWGCWMRHRKWNKRPNVLHWLLRPVLPIIPYHVRHSASLPSRYKVVPSYREYWNLTMLPLQNWGRRGEALAARHQPLHLQQEVEVGELCQQGAPAHLHAEARGERPHARGDAQGGYWSLHGIQNRFT